MTIKPIANYQVIARIGTPAPGARTNRYDIVLKDGLGNKIGVINFWKPDELEYSYMGSNGYPEVHLEEHHFANILDLLRNEQPLWFNYNPNPGTDSSGNQIPVPARIVTSDELIGEGE